MMNESGIPDSEARIDACGEKEKTEKQREAYPALPRGQPSKLKCSEVPRPIVGGHTFLQALV